MKQISNLLFKLGKLLFCKNNLLNKLLDLKSKSAFAKAIPKVPSAAALISSAFSFTSLPRLALFRMLVSFRVDMASMSSGVGQFKSNSVDELPNVSENRLSYSGNT